MSDDAWTGTEAKATPAMPGGTVSLVRQFPGGELPSVTGILGELLTDLMNNFGGWLSFGVGTLVIGFLSMLFVIVPYAVAFVPVFVDNDDRYVLPGMALMMVAILVVSILQIPWANGQYRALLRYQRGEVAFSVGAPLEEATTDIGSAFVLWLLTFVIALLAVMACYFPVFFVSALVGLAWPALVVHKLSPMEAVALSFRHARQYPMWTLGFWALGLGIALVGSQIPILGMMLAGPIYMAYHLRAYRQIYGDGPVPVETPVETPVVA
jgi:hypothetical protein